MRRRKRATVRGASRREDKDIKHSKINMGNRIPYNVSSCCTKFLLHPCVRSCDQKKKKHISFDHHISPAACAKPAKSHGMPTCLVGLRLLIIAGRDRYAGYEQ